MKRGTPDHRKSAFSRLPQPCCVKRLVGVGWELFPGYLSLREGKVRHAAASGGVHGGEGHPLCGDGAMKETKSPGPVLKGVFSRRPRPTAPLVC